MKITRAFDFETEAVNFLNALKTVAQALIAWAHKCSKEAFSFAQTLENEEKENLLKLSETLKKIPQKPAETFYEAILSIYVCFSYDPDSLGTLDRTLYEFYKKDIESVYEYFGTRQNSVAVKTPFIEILWASAATSSAFFGFWLQCRFLAAQKSCLVWAYRHI